MVGLAKPDTTTGKLSDACMDPFKVSVISVADEGRQCCLTTVLLNLKVTDCKHFSPLAKKCFLISNSRHKLTCVMLQPETPQGIALVHVHQTWLDGYAGRDQSMWIF